MKEREEEREIDIVIDTEDIANYLFQCLIERGYAPTQEEVEELSDIMFDYLVEKQAIQEMEDFEE